MMQRAKKQCRVIWGYAGAIYNLKRRTRPWFVLLSGGRRGSHLLIDLLNSHSEFNVDGEVLQPNAVHRMLFPRLYLRGCRARHPHKIYGLKASLRQIESQGLYPRQILKETLKSGGRIVHLVRSNLFRVAVSQQIAHIRGVHFDTVPNPLEGRRYVLNPERLVSSIRQKEIRRREEHETLAELPHIRLDYEADLLLPQQHQSTCDRIFAEFGVSPEPVLTIHQKRSPSDLSEIVTNYEEVSRALEEAGFCHYLTSADARAEKAA